MNILHITTFLQGGAGKVVLDLTKGAIEKGHSVSVASTKDSVDGYGNYPEHILGLKHLEVPLTFLDSTFSRKYEKNLQAATALFEQIRQNPPDLIHSHSCIPSLVAKIAVSKVTKEIPIIQTMHGWGIYKSAQQQVQDISILNQVNHVVSISKASEDLLVLKGLSNTNKSIIYNGLPAKHPSGSLLDDEHLLQIKKLKKDGKKVIGVIGTVDKRKNQTLVLEALSSLPKDLEVHAFFIGEGKDLGSYRHKAEELGLSKRVTFTGYKAGARFFVGEFDILVSASLSEGATPLAVLEAFADKTPVLAADTPENKEAVIDSQNGFLFKSNNSQHLSEKIHNCLVHPGNQEVVLNAQNLFKSRFTIEKTRENYLLLYGHKIATDY